MVKEKLVRTALSHQREKENIKLCMDLTGARVEGEMPRHILMAQIRIMHETINDLVLELFRVSPNHIIFKELPELTHVQLCDTVAKTTLPEDGVNKAPDVGWVGKQIRNKLHF